MQRSSPRAIAAAVSRSALASAVEGRLELLAADPVPAVEVAAHLRHAPPPPRPRGRRSSPASGTYTAPAGSSPSARCGGEHVEGGLEPVLGLPGVDPVAGGGLAALVVAHERVAVPGVHAVDPPDASRHAVDLGPRSDVARAPPARTRRPAAPRGAGSGARSNSSLRSAARTRVGVRREPELRPPSFSELLDQDPLGVVEVLRGHAARADLARAGARTCAGAPRGRSGRAPSPPGPARAPRA